jgi:hypothetical protein
MCINGDTMKKPNLFPECTICGVAFDVGANSCSSRWCPGQQETIAPTPIPEIIVPAPRRKYVRIPKPRPHTLSRFLSIIARSKKKGLECNITERDIIELLANPCVYCGSPDRIEVDRMDSCLGYMVDNIAPACHRCNTVKSNVVSYDEMLKIAEILNWRNLAKTLL